MLSKEFFEEYPLYKWLQLEKRSFSIGLNEVSRPTINMWCDSCKSLQTYTPSDRSTYEEHWFIDDSIFRMQYVCRGCNVGIREFFLQFDNQHKWNDAEMTSAYTLKVRKIGQEPSVSLDIDKELEHLLGKHTDLYKKGLTCESHGYGIGAYSYFRRITEEIIDELLDSITDLIEESEKSIYEVALAKTKQTTVTQEKIDLVKDLLPQSLRPDGMNPLSALHSALSEGLHSENDATCLEYADAIKKVLIYLVNQIKRNKETSRQFTEGMRKLLNKKTLKFNQ